MADCTSSSDDANVIRQKEPTPSHHQHQQQHQKQQQQHQNESTIKSIFSTPDLLANILHVLIDDDFLPSLSSLVLVSKNFREASRSDRLWRRVCRMRWKSKFGFRGRWERALEDYYTLGLDGGRRRRKGGGEEDDDGGRRRRERMERRRMEQQEEPSSVQVDELDSSLNNSTTNNDNNNNNNTKNNNFWKSRYFAEERDATRTRISATELEKLVFDFRFWIGQPTVVDGERIVVKSGLLESASREVRFSNSAPIAMDGDGGGAESDDDDDDEWSLLAEEFPGGTWSARGRLTGHPCREPGIEWLLDEGMGIVQWGFIPNLWPQGNIQRLDNWGWQIQNPNVILRSIDDSTAAASAASSSTVQPSEANGGWDEAKLDEIERECSRSDGRDVSGNEMWRDLLDTMVNIPLRNTPSVNGFRVTADIPRAFMEQYE